MAELPEYIEAAVIRPGDKLVLRFKVGTLTDDRMDYLQERLRELLPESIDVLLIEAEQLAVVRGDD